MKKNFNFFNHIISRREQQTYRARRKKNILEYDWGGKTNRNTKKKEKRHATLFSTFYVLICKEKKNIEGNHKSRPIPQKVTLKEWANVSY
jgi:hypothetical protein